MIFKPRFWKKHNELHIVTSKNRDPDILDHLFQKMCSWKQGEQAMAAPGQNKPRMKMILKDIGQRNVHGHSQGDMKTGPPTPSRSRMRREGATPPRRYTGIRGSSRQLIIMWPPWG